MSAVCAVVSGSSPELEEVVAAQGAELVVDDVLRSGVERALRTRCEWLWVLEGESVPRPGALQGLLDGHARADGLPEPVLFTGMILTPDGAANPRRTAWYRRFHLHVALDSVDHRLVPVRGSGGPVLVERAAAAADLPRAGAPVSPGSVLEWTARLLRFRNGYLVPESESVAAASDRDPLLDPVTALRLMFGPALLRLDRLALVLELFERAGAHGASAGR